MTRRLRALIVEDTPADAELLMLRLKSEGIQVDWQRVDDEPAYLEALQDSPDVILADWSLPHFSGLRALQLRNARGLDIPFIIISGSIGEEAAVDAMRQGADDYLLKDRVARLGQAMRHALDDRSQREEKRRAEAALRASEEKYRKLFSGMLIGGALHEIICDPDGKPVDYVMLEVNDAFEAIMKVNRKDVIGKPASTLLPEDELKQWLDIFAPVALDEKSRQYELYLASSQKYFEGTVYSPEKGKFAVTFSDVTQRKLAEKALQASLADKTVLLREIHHRVKNNLEVILSLADLQARRLKDPQSLESLKLLQERIRSIALVHESIYRSPEIAHLQAEAYLKKLTDNIYLAFGFPGVVLNCRADPIALDMDTAVPFGLIVTELVTNSLKYAFPEDFQAARRSDARTVSEILVDMRRNDKTIRLQISDNGIGLPADFDWKEAQSFGLRLVNRLVEQLHGSIDIQVRDGTTTRIELPAKHD